MMRTAITDFALANKLYAGAIVTFYTVSAGVKTTTKATLYAAATGTTQLANPQTLDSTGKLRQAVYIEAPTIATVSGLTVDDHDTGIINPAPSFRINTTTYLLEYSFDGGTTWASSGNTLFKHRGAWVTGTSYASTDTFTDSGTLYYATSAHTAAASLATDIAAGRVVAVSSLSLPVSVANGGTGSTSAATARTALGAAASGANTDITSVYLNNTGLKIKDTNASHGLSVVPGSDLTADRTLSVVTGDADRTLTLYGNATLAGGSHNGTNTGDLAGHSSITAALGADVNLSNTGSFFTGPTIAQGSTGTWFVSGRVTLEDTVGGAKYNVKLWDGTTVVASARTYSAGGSDFLVTVALSGYIAAPAGDLRISVQDVTSTSGKIRFNASGSSKDSMITAFRVA